MRSVGAAKVTGVAVSALFTFLLDLVFTQKNLYQTKTSSREKPMFSKNTVYRLLLTSTINWEMFIRRLSAAVIPEIKKLTSETRKTALIIDDTPYWRNRSKKVEMLSRCYDHSEKKYYKGFNMLNIGWSDGQSFVPVDFRLLASGNDKNLLHGSHVNEGQTNAHYQTQNSGQDVKAHTSYPNAQRHKRNVRSDPIRVIRQLVFVALFHTFGQRPGL